MPLISPRLRSLHCTVLKKIIKPNNQVSIFFQNNEETINSCEEQGKPSSSAKAQHTVTQQVICYPLDENCNSQIKQDIEEDQIVRLFIDDNFAKKQLSHEHLSTKDQQQLAHSEKVVALQLPDQSPQLLYPKALQQMPYLRLFKEAFLVAIPWLGLLISLFGLLYSAKAKINQQYRPLRFSFTPLFYLTSSVLCCYPLVLIYFSLNQYLPLAIIVSYGFLCLLNYIASISRNQQVKNYNTAILAKIPSLSLSN